MTKLIDTKKLFLFDFDGTLVDTSLDILASSNYVRKQYNLPPKNFKEIEVYIGIGQQSLVEGVISDNPKPIDIIEALNHYRKHHEENLTQNVIFYPDVIETLEKLIRQEKQLGIITNKYSFYTARILRHLGQEKLFSLVYGPDNVPNRKPAPDPIYQAVKKLNIKLDECIMVGDSIFDIQAGKNAGITTVAVTYGFNTKEKLQMEKPDYTIDNFPELLKLKQ